MRDNMFDPFLSYHAPLSHLPPPGRVEAARPAPPNHTRLPHGVGSPGHAADAGAQPRVGVRARAAAGREGRERWELAREPDRR